MKVIWKYAFFPPPEGNLVTFDMPAGALVLDAQMQRDVPVMWAAVDPDKPREKRSFYIAGTGHPIENFHTLSYVATFQTQSATGTSLVFHIFEVVP